MKRKKAQDLAVLFHHRWAVPILAELHGSGGGKFVTLVARLSISRDSLTNTLRAMTEVPVAAVKVAPPQLVAAFAGLAIVTAAGIVSVNARLVADNDEPLLSMVKVSVEIWP